MTKLLLITLLMCLSSLGAQDADMKASKKEAKEFAKNQLSNLQQNLTNNTMGISEQELLPETDQGKTFDAKAAKTSMKAASSYAESRELNQFLLTAKKHEQLDENEAFLLQGQQIIENPSPHLDISNIELVSSSEEENLVTCQEDGTYQRSVQQKLLVQTTHDIKQSTKRCLGHEDTTQYDTVKKAKHHVTTKKEAFKDNPDIKTFEVHRDKATVTSIWTHKDNITICDHFSIDETVVESGVEMDSWVTDDSEILASIESSPSCKLLYTTPVSGPEARLINGKPIYREAWERTLHFSCESDQQSKCAQLRDLGAVFISKRCLKTTVFDECELWEKTYDLGKKAASQQTKVAFNKDALWGLNNEFDSSYEKNTDFGQVLTTLSIFSDLENNMEEQGTEFHEEVQIFKGEDLKCEKSFLSGQVFDCCKKMEGIAVDIKLASCKSEEQSLAKHRQQGKCHFIGSHKTKIGTVTEHVYCCFPSKIARVIHEQGRKQLKIKWGKADSPKCQGLTLEQLQKIDFSKIDLSEVIDDVKVDKQAYANKLKNSIEPLQTKIQAEIEKKRLESTVDPIKLEVIGGKIEEKNNES